MVINNMKYIFSLFVILFLTLFNHVDGQVGDGSGSGSSSCQNYLDFFNSMNCVRDPNTGIWTTEQCSDTFVSIFGPGGVFGPGGNCYESCLTL